jgi:hypothetical protein
VQFLIYCYNVFSENVPPVALNDDRVVEIQGEPLGVHKAVELIASHLRKFLVDHSVLPLFEQQVSQISFWQPVFLPVISFLCTSFTTIIFHVYR